VVEEAHRDYYIAQVARLLHDFDRKAERFSKVLALHVQQPKLRPTILQARQAFKNLIPEIPYIGGKGNRFTGDLIGCAMVLALYRALKGDGKSVEEIGKIVVEIEQDRVQSYPGFVVTLLGRLIHSPLGKSRLKKMAEESQARRYPGGWVAVYVEGDGEAFDFGIDYTECGLVKFFHQQGADELTPYLCLLDYVQQRAMDTGFFRSTTLAEGAEKCDFRWKRGRETKPAWPPPWLEN